MAAALAVDFHFGAHDNRLEHAYCLSNVALYPAAAPQHTQRATAVL